MGQAQVQWDFLWNPSVRFITLDKFDWGKIEELITQRYSLIAKSLPNDIIIPDPTPKRVQDGFFKVSPCLNAVLRKDSVQCFLRLIAESTWSMTWGFNITSETLTCMVRHDALRCARFVLEGNTPKLDFMHANPNCMNPCGYFPLHEAAERFSVNMTKLLFRYGASANVRTSGDKVPEGLLPLHVAVGNTCLHKYLEDNLFPHEDHQDYVYNLIHLLCLPEMVPQVEVLEHVSSILKEYGFCPKGEFIDITNLRPYDCNISDGQLDEKGHTDGNNASTEASYAHAAAKKAVKKKIPRGWDPTYTRRRYFPYWRSVLVSKYKCRVYLSAF